MSKDTKEQSEEVTIVIKKRVSVEVVDGGLFFVGYQDAAGVMQRKAATSAATLFATLGEVLGLQKQARKPRKPKEPKAE